MYVCYHETLKKIIKDPYPIVSTTSQTSFSQWLSQNFEEILQSLVLLKLLHYQFEYKIQFSL